MIVTATQGNGHTPQFQNLHSGVCCVRDYIYRRHGAAGYPGSFRTTFSAAKPLTTMEVSVSPLTP